MAFKEFEKLVGLRLSIVRRAADMLVVHFGTVRPHSSGKGTVGDYALHVQCPWRLDGPEQTITGSGDLWVYAGGGERPDHWSYEDGGSLQDRRFAAFFKCYDRVTRSWLNETDRLTVTAVEQGTRGDVRIALGDGYVLLVFPDKSTHEAWRFFKSDGDRHFVFPDDA